MYTTSITWKSNYFHCNCRLYTSSACPLVVKVMLLAYCKQYEHIVLDVSFDKHPNIEISAVVVGAIYTLQDAA